jgi:transcription elongation GreA/GreB family factor
MPSLDKSALLELVLAHLAQDVAKAQASAQATRAGAVHEEARPENEKDTRATEASYLARGQAARVEEMVETITRLRFLDLRTFAADDPIGPTAVVHVHVDGEERRYFLVPQGGGLEVEHEGHRVQLLTPSSPVGRALLGKRAGDDFEVRVGRRLREYEVLEVH